MNVNIIGKQKIKIMVEKLENHEVVKYLSKIVRTKRIFRANAVLIGGAVVDIIDGRKPKDYDIIDWNESFKNALIKEGFKFVTDTSTAITFVKDNITIQLLKTNSNDFEFSVSQSWYNLRDSKCELDEFSIKNKVLLPTNYTDKKAILNSLSRIPHWMRKGYKIKETTYYSLLNGLNTKEVKHISYPYTS